MLKCACNRKTKRPNHESLEAADNTPMEGIEDISASHSHTTAGNITRQPPGLPTANTTLAVHPQMVQDPLHTGLTQSIQSGSSNDTTSHYQNGHPAAAAPTSTQDYDPQRMYEGYIEDEFSRNGEIIMAAHSTRTISRTQIPTWQMVSTATDTSSIRSLLAALAFDLETTGPWNALGLSRLEGPTPNTHMLQSRRDVAIKLIDSCSAALNEHAQQEIHKIRADIGQACEKCCADLDTNAQERRHLKGNNRNVPRWMEPSDDLLAHLTRQTTTNGKIALHLSNLTSADITSHTNIMDVTACRQIHKHLCGTPDEIERALTHLGDQPLTTWAPTDNGQLLKVAAAVRNIHNTRTGQAQLTLAVPFDPYSACDKATDITDVWDHPLLHTKWKDVVVDITLLTPPTRIVVSGLHAPIHAHKCISLFTLGRPNSRALPQLTSWQPNFFSFTSGPIINVDTPAQYSHAARGLITTMGLPALQTVDHPRPSLGTTKDMPRSTIQLHMEHGKLSPIHLETLLT